MSRQLIACIGAAVALQVAAPSPAFADPPRHWFFDHYRTYEAEAFDYRAQPRVYRPRAFSYEPMPWQEREAYAPGAYEVPRDHPWRERRVRYDLSPSLSDKAARKMEKRRRSRALVPPPRPREKPLASEPRTAAIAPSTQETVTAVEKPVPAKPVQQSRSVPATSAISCDEARGIVAGFGFSNIETRSCSGAHYSFAAKRGGKPFTIKLSSANGELTEVNRQ